jgi:signal transduction histidine kinase
MAGAPRRRELVPYLALLATLTVTAAAGRYAYLTGVREDQLRFESAADEICDAIVNKLDSYVAMLLGGAGLFAASEEVTRDDFSAYVQRLEVDRRYPGIQGIGFSRLIGPADRDEVLAELQRTVPGARFWPDQFAGDFNAIVYLEPEDQLNRRAMGYDMASESVRGEAMGRARDSGAPAASGKVRLVQEGPDAGDAQAGFLIYVPVYRDGTVPASVEQRRRSLLGFVYSPFRAEDMLRSSVSRNVPGVVGFEVFDGTPSEASLMYRSPPGISNRHFQVIRPLEIETRKWTVRLYADESIRNPSTAVIVALIALGGINFAVLLFGAMRRQVAARLEAERAAEELRRSEERLRTADRAKDEFLATISHELRTPLNAIVGWASMLGRGAVPNEMFPHAINVIARNAAAQARLVEDLLDMSRVIGGHLRLHVSDVDPAALIDAAIESFRPAAHDAGVTVDYRRTPLGTVEADAGRLQQIVSNLLSNGIKFTPRGGTLTITAERSDEMLTIRVKDTGIGMDPDFVPFVFDRFRQADSSTTRTHPGAGLGLAIARHLVQLHGGSIEASSEGTGRGSTFVVRLPVRRPGA